MPKNDDMPNIGEVLAQEFLGPMNISQNALAKALGIPQNRLSDIINGKRGISADTDLRLCRYFGLTDGYFTGMQMDFERIAARRKIQRELEKIVPLKVKSA
jgi:addiction module HigA family antidote